MLRDDPDTVALVAAMRGRHRQIGSDVPPGRLHHCFWPTVDEIAAVTGLSWATVHDGDILTPIPITPATPDRCLTHFLGVVARECRSTKTGQIMSGRHGRETEP